MAMIIASSTPQSVNVATYNRGYIGLISAIAALGGLLFGFDLAIISGTVSSFAHFFQLNDIETGWAVGCINLGSALGALLAAKMSDVLGRKKSLLMCAFLFALTGVGTGWAGSFWLFIVFRMMSGVAVGAAAMVCPMYIAEISPAKFRGQLVAFYQLAITLGILMAYLSNYLLLPVGENNWRWMFSSQTIPSLLFFFGLFLVSESPRWLIRKKRLEHARKVLTKIGGTEYAIQEGKSIELSFDNEVKENVNDIFKKDVSLILIIGIMIAIFSQAGGQNSLFSYAPQIFSNAGFAANSAFLQSLTLGLINFMFTFVAIFTIDKIGRKRLLRIGSISLFIDGIAIGLSFYLKMPGIYILGFVLAFIAIYAATIGPVTWVALSEIFPNRIRGNAMSAVTLALWIANFFTIASFPVMKTNLGLPITFAIHAVICLMYFVFIHIYVPETKGKSLEEIEKQLIRTEN